MPTPNRAAAASSPYAASRGGLLRLGSAGCQPAQEKL